MQPACFAVPRHQRIVIREPKLSHARCAQVAEQQGRYLAKVLNQEAKGGAAYGQSSTFKPEPFVYRRVAGCSTQVHVGALGSSGKPAASWSWTCSPAPCYCLCPQPPGQHGVCWGLLSAAGLADQGPARQLGGLRELGRMAERVPDTIGEHPEAAVGCVRLDPNHAVRSGPQPLVVAACKVACAAGA
jgi:hypothetical protein